MFITIIIITESLLNWKTFTGPNSGQLPFLYVITQPLETVNVDLELDYGQENGGKIRRTKVLLSR